MIIYFADRLMQVLGHATTNLQKGFVIKEDLKTEDVETGVATFTCTIGFNETNRKALEAMTNAGNYLLRSHDGENEFYTIIDAEINTKNQDIYIYAEDAGLDLINEIAGEFEDTESHNAEWYINKYIIDSGFEIGINEIPADTVRKLKWEGESTVTARLASIATQFGGFEISYSFAIKGLTITHKYLNIYQKRGKDAGVQLRLNMEIDKIITTKSVANLATAFVCEGGVPDNAEEPITLKDLKEPYDDGDFFVDVNGVLKSRKANEKWSRYVWNKEPNRLDGYEGYIVRPYSYNTPVAETLLSHAITELKKVCDMEVNYETDIKKLPEGVKIGDRINIIDDAGEMYVSTRVLKLETSVVDQAHTATLGEHLIKTSGIHQKVMDLAAQFAKTSQSAARALAVANSANTAAVAAQGQAEAAAKSALDANTAAEEAQKSASAASGSAATAEAKALAAEAAVGRVEASVQSITTSVENAQKAAEDAEAAATTATGEAEKAATAASNAEADAAEAKTAAGEAKTAFESAIAKADTAIDTAGEASKLAQSASDTAAAAKLDAEQAEKDVENFGKNLETYRQTMEADYVRNTDLTQTTSQLQAQITANANQLEITHSQVTIIDETANDAKEMAEAAQSLAATAQSQADQATADAQAAQDKANEAASAAASAQSEADKAKAAADTAKSVADKAEADLVAAQADLATISGRVDTTKEEIAAAEQAVADAQAAANEAKANATTATEKAEAAQEKANKAETDAAEAKGAADDAAKKANAAQKTADEAKDDATAAQNKATEAVDNAAAAQRTADQAVLNAKTADDKAQKAQDDAAEADRKAKEAAERVATAQTNLATAKQNLANTLAKVDATEAEIAAAEQAVADARASVDAAMQSAAEATGAAELAAAFAKDAQIAADEAHNAADNAQTAADDAKDLAAKAQKDAADLASHVEKNYTTITKTNELIGACATKTDLELLQVGGRNRALGTSDEWIDITVTAWSGQLHHTVNGVRNFKHSYSDYGVVPGDTITFGVDISAVGKMCSIRVDYYAEDGSTYAKIGNYIQSGETGRSTLTLDIWEEYIGFNVYIGSNGAVSEDITSQYKCLKIEKGTKATDWTPAPEDVTAEMLAADEALRGELETQSSELVVTAQEAVIKHVGETFVKNDDEYKTFRSRTESELTIDGQGISAVVKSTDERLTGVDGKLQDEITEREKHFDFTDEGLKIHTGTETDMALVLDNDEAKFTHKGVDLGTWSGEKQSFTTKKVIAEEELHILPFAFKVRTEADGSKTLTLSKAGS